MNNMSLLESITRGREGKPPRLLVYGQEGTGKSIFAAGAPSSVFVQTEDGQVDLRSRRAVAGVRADGGRAGRNRHRQVPAREEVRGGHRRPGC